MRVLLRATAKTAEWLAVLVAVGGFWLFAGTSGVRAHAEPDEIRPGNGAVVTSIPAGVNIVMTQEMARQPGANDIDVIAADGTEVTTEAATLDLENRRKLTVPLPGDLTPGLYTVRWKTLSAEDGDSETGDLSFTYDPNGNAAPGIERLGEEPSVAPTITAGGDGDVSPFSSQQPSTRGTWVAAAAAGIAGLAIGGTLAFLLVQRRMGPLV